LLVSLFLRWILIFRGGQYYFSDEQRYETSRIVADLTLHGKFSEALSQLFTAPEHLGFKTIGLIPAIVEYLTRESLVIPAIFFSFFSILNLFLIYQISKRIGSSSKESLYVLFISASVMSLLYFTRHLMPYDAALTFGLSALYFALTDKPTFKTSLACGGLSFLCFITYNGYWSLAGLAMLVHVLASHLKNVTLSGASRHEGSLLPKVRDSHLHLRQVQVSVAKNAPSERHGIFEMGTSNNGKVIEILRKAYFTSLGFILPAILLFAVAMSVGINLLTEYRTFATTVSQGSYAEGWSLPFEYFWHTEHLVIVVLGLLSLYALIESRGRTKSLNVLAAGLIFIYVCLLIPSVFLHSFVVYGRLARQMMPLLILLSASGLVKLEQNYSYGRNIVRLVLAVIFVQAAWNYRTSYDLSYPREFASKIQTQYPDFDFSEKRLAFGAPTLCQNNGYIIENVKYFVTPPEPNPRVQGELLVSASHPDNFLPYQYEGYTYEQRQKFRVLNLQMRFYKADSKFMPESNPNWISMKGCVVKEN